jgi:sigma-E factor negative regulatory protein RseB
VGSAVPLVLLIGLVGFVPSAAATAAPAEEDDTRALLLLRRAVVAATSLGYSGTQVVTSWRPDGDTARLVDVRQWPDGRRVETLRDAADAVAPAGAAGASESSGSASSASRTISASRGAAERALSLRALDVLAASYELRVSGRSWVAGRVATLVTALRGDAVAARLWVDDRTGLLLRQEINDAAGNVRRMFAFIEVRPGSPEVAAPFTLPADRRIPDAGPPRARAVNGAFVREQPPRQSPVPGWQRATSDSQRQGWCAGVECPDTLPAGFRLLDVRRGTAAGAPVVQLVYSDGLSSISVFQQPGRLDPEKLTGFRADTWDGARVYVGEGWPLRLTWQGGQRVFTAVSDAEAPDLHAAISTFPQERTETDDGAFTAIGRGMRSVLEWLQGD